MITRVDHKDRGKPVPDHLRIEVRDDVIFEQRVDDLLNMLKEQSFDTNRSRVLVFCMSRRDTEDQAQLCGQQSKDWAEVSKRVGFFHAGMSKEDRDETFERYKDGNIVILFATKAFGMGLDVPNIHYVFHLKPPSSLEDYLQEIGRAGRNEPARKLAGFSDENPVTCVLYASQDDFKRNKDWLHKKQLAWDDISRIQAAVLNYARRIRALVDTGDSDHAEKVSMHPFPLPLNLVEQTPEFSDSESLESIQALGLYWLEMLHRVRLGYYLPAYLEFENRLPDNIPDNDLQVKNLCDAIHLKRQETTASESVLLISSSDLLSAVHVPSLYDLLRVIVRAQRIQLVRLLYRVKLLITKKRTNNIDHWNESFQNICKTPLPWSFPETLPPFLEAGYEATNRILRVLPPDRFIELDLNWLFDECRQVSEDYFAPVDKSPEAIKVAERESKDFLKPSRAKAIMTLIRSCPAIQMRSDLEENGIVHRLRFDPRERNRPTPSPQLQLEWIRKHRDLSIRVLSYIHCKQIAQEAITLTDMVLELEVPNNDVALLEQVLLHLRWMGYVKMGSILPMAVELYMESTNEIDKNDPESHDFHIYNQFLENRQLKVLRLVALQTLTEIVRNESQKGAPSSVVNCPHRLFILAYFQTTSVNGVLNLITESLKKIDPKSTLLKELSEAALKEHVDKLSFDQKAVYDAATNKSVMVVAGPGSGKTHTLLLRLVRLIHESNVDPSSILVLAYNRAVVVEIRYRLAELLTQLGYGSLVSPLKVFTFHGLALYCLRKDLDNKKLTDKNSPDPWVEYFLHVTKTEPGKITRWIDPAALRYIFVDEYQDISALRYQMLQWLARDHCSVTVIGDPDQSIYGYERANAGESTRASDPFFQRFQKEYQADHFTLRSNFRSFEQILRAAETLITRNSSRKDTEPLRADRSPKIDWSQKEKYVQCVRSETAQWYHCLKDILEESTDHNQLYTTIAVLFRSNAEVYQAFQTIREHLGEQIDKNKITLTVQGDGGGLVRTREVGAILAFIQNPHAIPTETICTEHDVISLLNNFSNHVWRPAWNAYAINVVIALLRGFVNEITPQTTFFDLVQYLSDSLEKDDGQLQKLVRLDEKNRQETYHTRSLVVSTLHKVKGLEFDAVIMPASRAALMPDRKNKHNINSFTELVEEERRLQYVGMTRARDRLITFHGPREAALENGLPYDPQTDKANDAGLLFDGDSFDGRQTLFRAANKTFIRNVSRLGNEKAFFDYLHQQVQSGDPLTLVRRGKKDWYIQHGNYILGQLSGCKERRHDGKICRGTQYVNNWISKKGLTSCQKLEGLAVTDVIRFNLDESKEYDSQNESNFTKHWSPFFRDKGFTYILNFAGYARPVVEEPSY